MGSRTRGAGLFIAMAAAIGVVAALAWWDGEREGRAAIDALAQQQATLAACAAANATPPGAIERPGELAVLQLSSQGALTDSQGKSHPLPDVTDAFSRGDDAVILERAAAASLGLPERRAVVGLARAADGHGVAVVTTARGERDRESRARVRLFLSVGVASAIVFAFGAIARKNQRKELELERELALADLSRAGEDRLSRAGRVAMMGTLAMGVAHEISTPLGVISGRAEQLLSRAEDERSRRGLQVILEQTARIAQVVRGFLDLSRGREPTLARRDPAEVARNAAKLVEHRFEQAGVRLQTAIDTAIPEVQCDARLMEHALVNLLLNGCQASPRGQRVELSVHREDSRVVFEVLDHGAGIEPDDAAHAFEPFFTTKPAGEGTGLGLAITNEIVKAHRGTLALEPADGGGTRATMAIPLASSVNDA